MFLSNKTIQEYINLGKINISEDCNIEPTGITVNLGGKLLLPIPNQNVDLQNPIQPQYQEIDISQNDYILKPNEFVLGSTLQKIQTSKDIITFLDGRSTFARVGLSIHLTAMTLDGLPFSMENSVLEIKNNGPFNITLHFKEKIGTYLFSLLTEPILGEKDSVYINQNGVQPPIIE